MGSNFRFFDEEMGLEENCCGCVETSDILGNLVYAPSTQQDSRGNVIIWISTNIDNHSDTSCSVHISLLFYATYSAGVFN